MAEDEAALAAACERAAAEGAAAGRRALLEERDDEESRGAAAAPVAAPLERQEAVEAGFRRAVEALGRLKRDMPATVAKMERARVAAGYVVGEKKG